MACVILALPAFDGILIASLDEAEAEAEVECASLKLKLLRILFLILLILPFLREMVVVEVDASQSEAVWAAFSKSLEEAEVLSYEFVSLEFMAHPHLRKFDAEVVEESAFSEVVVVVGS